MKVKKNFNCTIEGCNNEFYAKGLCRRHYNQMKCSGKILDRFRNDKNEYEIYNSKVLISIYNRKAEIIEKAIIDKEDVQKAKKYKWYLSEYGYIATTLKNRKNLFLHRYLMNCPKDKVVDHINHDKTDNRKCNLKICTQKENMQNLKKQAKGISKIKRKDKIYYILQLKGKYCGCFKSLEKAQKEKEKILGKSFL